MFYSRNSMQKIAGATQKQADVMKVHESAQRNLELEIQTYRAEAQNLRKQIYQLEKEREKYWAEATEQAQKYMQSKWLNL